MSEWRENTRGTGLRHPQKVSLSAPCQERGAFWLVILPKDELVTEVVGVERLGWFQAL